MAKKFLKFILLATVFTATIGIFSSCSDDDENTNGENNTTSTPSYITNRNMGGILDWNDLKYLSGYDNKTAVEILTYYGYSKNDGSYTKTINNTLSKIDLGYAKTASGSIEISRVRIQTDKGIDRNKLVSILESATSAGGYFTDGNTAKWESSLTVSASMKTYKDKQSLLEAFKKLKNTDSFTLYMKSTPKVGATYISSECRLYYDGNDGHYYLCWW